MTRCYYCARPLVGVMCSGCRQPGRAPVAGEIIDHLCGCKRLPLAVAADALRLAADALDAVAEDLLRLGPSTDPNLPLDPPE